MRYWFDTEFIEDGKTIDLISIGMISGDGRELYLCNSECDFSRAEDWVRDNVLTYLSPLLVGNKTVRPREITKRIVPSLHQNPPWKTHDGIRQSILEFCDPEKYGKPEFWGYYSSYDWVVLCQLFGRMIDLPKGFPMFCRDIKQWAVQLGDPKLPKDSINEHEALADARWVRDCWYILDALDRVEA